MRSKRIGFFDSGVGGLTISEAVREALPNYNTLYLGDTMRSPYGERTHGELVEFTWQACEWLFAHDCELVIVACNSASASALREIQQQRLPKYPGKRVLGIIRPTVEELVKRGFGSILVLSTSATKKSGAYAAELNKLAPSISVTSLACPSWAPMIERGKAGTHQMRAQVEQDLADVAPKPEAVLLACTHYPYVRIDVENALQKSVPVFDQGGLVAASLKEYLDRHPEIESQLEKMGRHEYFVTGDVKQATNTAENFFGYNVDFRRAVLAD